MLESEVPLKGERGGHLPDPAWKRRALDEPWYPGDSWNMGIGQGALLVTPLQLARAYAMLANGVVWIWMQALPIFIKSTDQLIVAAIAEFSWVIFVFGGYISSRQVCKRADEKHLLVGLKLAAVSWVMGIFIMFTLAPMPDARLMVALII